MIQFIKSLLAFLPIKIQNMSKVDYTDTSNWILLLKLLQLIGQLPITILNSRNKHKPEEIKEKSLKMFIYKIFHIVEEQHEQSPKQILRFNIKYISKVTIYTICFGLVRVPFVWVLSTKAKHCRSLKNNLTTISVNEDIICPITYYLIPPINNMEWLCLVFTAGYFCRFLNNWDKFNQLVIFTKGKAVAKLQGNQVVNNSASWSLLLFLIIFPLNFITSFFRDFEMETTIKESFFEFWYLLAEITALLDDLKFALMLLSVATGFQKVTKFEILI